MARSRRATAAGCRARRGLPRRSSPCPVSSATWAQPQWVVTRTIPTTSATSEVPSKPEANPSITPKPRQQHAQHERDRGERHADRDDLLARRARASLLGSPDDRRQLFEVLAEQPLVRLPADQLRKILFRGHRREGTLRGDTPRTHSRGLDMPLFFFTVEQQEARDRGALREVRPRRGEPGLQTKTPFYRGAFAGPDEPPGRAAQLPDRDQDQGQRVSSRSSSPCSTRVGNGRAAGPGRVLQARRPRGPDAVLRVRRRALAHPEHGPRRGVRRCGHDRECTSRKRCTRRWASTATRSSRR